MWPILLLRRVHPVRPRVHTEGRNWLVVQDLVGVCHMHTCVPKKIPRQMNFRVYTRSTVNSSDKIAFSDSLEHQWHWCFPHYEGHTTWWLVFIMDVYPGGSDQMMYQHMPVLTADITVSSSSVKVGCMFSQKNWSTRRFFYVDNTNFQVYLRENLKICVIWRVYGSVFWVLTKSNRRTPTNQVLESRGKDLKLFFC